MILHRVFPRQENARPGAPGGALWIARAKQGWGRHDNPDAYGCVYVSEAAVASVAESLAPYANRRFRPEQLQLDGLPLALATIELDDDAELVDLDQPAVLTRERLRPSLVATRQRDITQPQALRLFRRHPHATGLRWWSRLESLWMNVTLFDRATERLNLLEVRDLSPGDAAVREAAELLGLAASVG